MHADEQIKFDLSFSFILCYFRPKLVSVTMTDISATFTSNILFFFQRAREVNENNSTPCRRPFAILLMCHLNYMSLSRQYHTPITVGSRSTKMARGTCFPDPVSLKNVLKESSP